MDEDFFKRDLDAPPKRDHLFAWTVFILLLSGAAIACWLGSFYIFGHPEKPDSYKFLKKLHKIEAPKRFEITAGPAGEFLNAQKLYERYSGFSRLQLAQENDELLRNYIKNYEATKKLVPYVIGRFNILDSYELKPADVFSSGVVALAQSVDYPQTLIEHVYTADQKNVTVLRRMLQTGLDVKLEKTLDLAAVIHIERLFNGSYQFTVVPLLYGSYALKQGAGTFNLDPPLALNLEPGLPVLKEQLLQDALKTFAEYKRTQSPEINGALLAPAASATPTPASEELVRMDSAPLPDEPVATPTPKMLAQTTTPNPRPLATPRAGGTPVTARAVPAPTLTTALLNNPRPAPGLPRATPVPVAPATPVAVSPQGVPLTPFLQAAPAPNMAQTGGVWKVYPAGQMPRGRTVESTEAPDLAERGVGGERIYLRGQFLVTASGESRVVLRPQSGASKPGQAATRVIVEYPAGAQPPSEGAQLSRDEARPFLVTDVRRGADGQINVYAREITAP